MGGEGEGTYTLRIFWAIVCPRNDFLYFLRLILKTLQKTLCPIQKSLGVHKILVCKIWFPPPPEKGQNEERLFKSVENLQIDTFSRVGRNSMDKTILWTSGRWAEGNSGHLLREMPQKAPIATLSLCSKGGIAGQDVLRKVLHYTPVSQL